MGLGTQPQCCVPSCKLFKNYCKVRHGVTLKYYVMFLQAGHWPSLLCSCHAESRSPRQDTLILHNRWKGNTFIEILWSCHLKSGSRTLRTFSTTLRLRCMMMGPWMRWWRSWTAPPRGSAPPPSASLILWTWWTLRKLQSNNYLRW